ncbi:MAG: hypothetical protein J5699_03415 [Bacteroidales bacterium]|nr:hypothetical protein [Bacteroidales bacterium]
MSDKFLESVKEKAKDIRSEVPKEMFDAIWENVGKKRAQRRLFGFITAAAAASAAFLAVILTVSPKESLIPELPGDTVQASSYTEPVSEDAESSTETVGTIPLTKAVADKQVAINQSIEQSAITYQERPTQESTVAVETDTGHPEKANPDNGRTFDSEYLAQFFDPEKEQPNRRKIHISVSGSTPGIGNKADGIVLFNKNSGVLNPATIGLGSLISIYEPDNNQDNTMEYRHRMPVDLRLMVSADIADRLSAEGGISYSYHHTSFIVDSSYPFRQHLHFIGIPVGLRFVFLTFKHSSLYAKVGGEVEKCISGSIVNETNKNRERLEIEPLFWSAEASVGAQVGIAGPLYLFAEGGGSYHFDNGTGNITYYGAHPLMFSLQAGLRIGL